jgi:hypothetical protein
MKLKKRKILTALLAFSLVLSMVIGDKVSLPTDTALSGMAGDAYAASGDEDAGGRFRIRFRNGADFDSAENVPGGMYNSGFPVHLFATVGGVPDPTATIHYTTSGSSGTRATEGGSGLVNANPGSGVSFVHSGTNLGHAGLSRFDGGVRPYTWDNATRSVNGITPGVPSFTGGTGQITVALEHVRSAFTISAVASRQVGGQTVYSEVITRTFFRGPRTTEWADNDFLIVSLYSDSRGIFCFDEGIFNAGVDFVEFMQAANSMGGPTLATALERRNSHITQGDFPPTLPANATRRGRGTDFTNTGGERMAHMEIFDPSLDIGDQQVASQRVGLRVKGGWSRGTFVNEQKTFEVYCRNSYGDRDNVLFPLFGDQHTSDGNLMHRYRRFRLRMGGNDREQVYVRDEFANTLARVATDEITPVHRPGVVFLNGAYYGLVWIRSPRTEDNWRRFYYAMGGQVTSNQFKFIGASEMGRAGCSRAGCSRALPAAMQTERWPSGSGAYNSVAVCEANPGQSGNCGRSDCLDFVSTPDAPCTWERCRGINGPGSWAEVRSLVLGGTTGSPGRPRDVTPTAPPTGGGITNEANWTRFLQLVDIDDMILFYALNIFGANVDWPANNCEMWRYFPHCANGEACMTPGCSNPACERNDPNLNHQLRDGRWRFKVHDMEFGYGLWNRGDPTPSATASGANTIHALINRTGVSTRVPGTTAYHFNATEGGSFMMTAILQRADMRAKLANTLMDLISGSHSAAFAVPIFNGLRDQIRDEHTFLLSNAFVSSMARNGTNAPGPGWPSEIGQVENSEPSMGVPTFMQERGAALQTHITTAHPSGLSQSGTGTATTLTINGDGGSATLNTRMIGLSRTAAPFPNDPRVARTVTVNYFGGVDIPVTAHPWSGYELDHFTVGGTPVPAAQVQYDHGRQFINVQPGAQVGVSFRTIPGATVQISRVQARSQNWFEITNYTNRTLTTRGLYLSDNYNADEESEQRRPHDHRFRMPALIVRPGETVFFALASNDTDDHLKRAQANFGLTFGERFRLADARGNILQHIEISLMGHSQIQQRGGDGFWAIIDGPCRDCDRCGCTQCFGATNGYCNRNTCARCWCFEPPCNRLLVDCICGPAPGRPLVEGNIESVVVNLDGRQIRVDAIGMPQHAQPINFRVQIRLPGEWGTPSGVSAPPGINWSVSGDVLTISTAPGAVVAWGSGLGSAGWW